MLIIGKKLSPYALLSISGLLAASDQAVKWLVQQSMAYGEYVSVTVVVKKSVASEFLQAACFSGSATVTWSSRSGLSDTVPTGVQLRVLPLQRAGLASRAA